MHRHAALTLFVAVFVLPVAACGGDKAGTVPFIPKADGGEDAATSDDDASVPVTTGEDISAWVETKRAAFNAPALGAAVFDEDGFVASGVAGVRRTGDAYKDTTVKLPDRWHLGTCTTALTATLVGVLVDEHTVAWSDTLADLLPGEVATMKEAYKTITLDQLLGHRGGFPEQVPAGIWSLINGNQSLEDQRAILAGALLARDPDITPGTTYSFSNAGYIVVAAALEKRTGASFEDLLRFKVFSPLGMTCGFGPPATAPDKLDQPWGHTRDESDQLIAVPPTSNGDSPAAQNPASRVNCSMRDWGLFARAHLRGAKGEDNILTPNTYEHVHTALTGQAFAAGWRIQTESLGGVSGKTYSQTGTNTRNYAALWIAPSLSRVFMVVTNYADDDAEANLENTIRDLASEAYAQP